MVKLNTIDLDVVPRLADPEFARAWVAMVDEDAVSKDARIAQTEAALREIARMKPSPIGDTGFSTGPLALFQACQRIARDGLRRRRHDCECGFTYFKTTDICPRCGAKRK